RPIRRQAEKEHELPLAAREQREPSTQPDTTPKAPSSLEKLRNAFLAMKRKERKRDRTALDEYTIRAYEGLVQDFIYITKCQYPSDVTRDRVNDWMLLFGRRLRWAGRLGAQAGSTPPGLQPLPQS